MALVVDGGGLVNKGGALGTGAACCCGKCFGPCDSENPCPEGCDCVNGNCVASSPCPCDQCGGVDYTFSMPSRGIDDAMVCVDFGSWVNCPLRGNTEQSFSGTRDGYNYSRFIAVQIFCGTNCPDPYPGPGEYYVNVSVNEVWDDGASSFSLTTAWYGIVKNNGVACAPNGDISVSSSSLTKEQQSASTGLDFEPDTEMSWSIGAA